MKYFSTNGKSEKASFKEALLRGLAPDKGLYFPETIPVLPPEFYQKLAGMSLPEIGTWVVREFVGNEIPGRDLQNILEEVLNFPIPLVKVEENVHSLELFHGPTLSFKDVGARFMARAMGWFMRGEGRELTVLVATSGDTGSAVANGFLGVQGINVIILYPSGKVSEIQEKQLTTLGQNITALEVEGTFDTCQAMVKSAFVDPVVLKKLNLTSANSINVGRLVPQTFYYFHAFGALGVPDGPVYISVPSGNFGNLTAGLMARRMGLPISKFIASTNINDIVPQYLATGAYHSRPSVPTLSNAMDVGDPSNFVRMMALFQNSHSAMGEVVAGYSFDDVSTRDTILRLFQTTGYLPDPHGAVGYLGLKNFQMENQGTGIFLETAHPAKFKEVVEEAIGGEIGIPPPLQVCMDKEKASIKMKGDYPLFRDFLLSL